MEPIRITSDILRELDDKTLETAFNLLNHLGQARFVTDEDLDKIGLIFDEVSRTAKIFQPNDDKRLSDLRDEVKSFLTHQSTFTEDMCVVKSLTPNLLEIHSYKLKSTYRNLNASAKSFHQDALQSELNVAKFKENERAWEEILKYSDKFEEFKKWHSNALRNLIKSEDFLKDGYTFYIKQNVRVELRNLNKMSDLRVMITYEKLSPLLKDRATTVVNKDVLEKLLEIIE